jgi:hypothetical protein
LESGSSTHVEPLAQDPKIEGAVPAHDGTVPAAAGAEPSYTGSAVNGFTNALPLQALFPQNLHSW